MAPPVKFKIALVQMRCSEDPADTSRGRWTASEAGVVVIGSLFERRAAGVYHNTAVVIDADGRLCGSYRKMHIQNRRYRRNGNSGPGEETEPCSSCAPDRQRNPPGAPQKGASTAHENVKPESSSVAQVEVEAALGKVVSLAGYRDLLRGPTGEMRSGGKVVGKTIPATEESNASELQPTATA